MAKKNRNQATLVSPRVQGTSIPKVDYMRPEVGELLPIYSMIRDVIHGEFAIKGFSGGAFTSFSGAGNGGLPLAVTDIVLSRARRYLPMPNAADKSPENIERYRAYVTRAVFYEVTSRTLEGMAGQIFLRDPEVNIPKELEVMVDDADGGGLSLMQTAATAVINCVAFGRAGMLVDYPVTAGATTKAQLADGDIRPTFTIYEPHNIINWRSERRGAKRVLTLVVLRETLDENDGDDFVYSPIEQRRVLKLDPTTGAHVVEIWRKGANSFAMEDTFNPTDSKGKALTEIPFHFVGSRDNSEAPNKPPIYGLASVNIGHYRNSADYEESCFITGQPQIVMIGLTQDWVDNVLKGVVPIGARSSIPLPVGASVQMLQAKENSMPYEAMLHKEDQMVAIGAKLVQNQRQATKTATQKIIETTSESSTLANIAKNVSQIMEWALATAADFVGAAKDTIKYQLNKDFDLTSMTADDQNAVIKEWQSGAVEFTEMRTVLRRAGIAILPDAEARAAIKKDIEDGMIPDPAQVTGPVVPPDAVPAQKAASEAGGPQPTRPRRASNPGRTA